MRSKSGFEPHGPIYGLFLVGGCRRRMCTNSWAFGGLLGAVRGHMLEGPRGPFGTVKSSCMCRVATIPFFLGAVSSKFWGISGQKKRLILALNCRFRNGGAPLAHSWPPPFSFWLILCVVVPHTHRQHPPKFWPNPKHHDGAMIFAHFARACCLLACLLLTAC